MPREVELRTKGQIARTQIEAALAAGIARGVVLADAGYGDETDFRDWLIEQQFDYVMGVRTGTSVWWGEHQPAKAPPPSPRGGRPCTRTVRDAKHRPISASDLARTLPPKCWRNVSWREGTNTRLSSRFARVRVHAAHVTEYVMRNGC